MNFDCKFWNLNFWAQPKRLFFCGPQVFSDGKIDTLYLFQLNVVLPDALLQYNINQNWTIHNCLVLDRNHISCKKLHLTIQEELPMTYLICSLIKPTSPWCRRPILQLISCCFVQNKCNAVLSFLYWSSSMFALFHPLQSNFMLEASWLQLMCLLSNFSDWLLILKIVFLFWFTW